MIEHINVSYHGIKVYKKTFPVNLQSSLNHVVFSIYFRDHLATITDIYVPFLSCPLLFVF